MSGKTLSNGTLSLRFMQNAQRAKQLQEVQLEQAKVKDVAEWQVPHEVRDAWDAIPRREAEQSVTYEASYIPFLFPASNEAGPSTRSNLEQKIRGRRVFKHGTEVTNETKEKEKEFKSSNDDEPMTNRYVLQDPPDLPKDSRLNSPKKHSKSAKQVIFDTSGVGADLRSSKIKSEGEAQMETITQATTPLSNAAPKFLKPSSVYDPKASSKDDSSVKRQRSTSPPSGPKSEKPRKKKKRDLPAT